MNQALRDVGRSVALDFRCRSDESRLSYAIDSLGVRILRGFHGFAGTHATRFEDWRTLWDFATRPAGCLKLRHSFGPS